MTSAFTLVVGNKNYSSWSLRGFLAARAAGVPFDEVLVRLSEPGSKRELLKHSPAGKVPTLKHGERVIWDSLAIIEYLAEIRPDCRAVAGGCRSPRARPLDRRGNACGLPGAACAHADEPQEDPAGQGPGPRRRRGHRARLRIWRDCRTRFGADGPFLFGRFSAADAMYTPVATRFRTYAVELDDLCQAYVDAVLTRPDYLEWHAAALEEPWVIAEDEVA